MSKITTHAVLGLLCVYLMTSQLSVAAEENAASNRRIAVDSQALTEMSGMTASAIHNNRYWAHNDSGDRARLFAFDGNGTVLSELKIKGAGAFDWEDMDSFRDGSDGFLLVGDIGDNMAFRPFTDVYLVKEPTELKSPTTEGQVLRHFILNNEDGPRDAEALAVDGRARFVYILSKRDTHPRLYRFSLDALPGQPVPLNYLGEVRSIPSVDKHQAQGTGRISHFSPTAMAFSPEGDAAIIVTLRNTYYFPRATNQTWLQALNETPMVVKVKRMPQIEAGTFSRDGAQLLIGSEGIPAKIEILPRPKSK